MSDSAFQGGKGLDMEVQFLKGIGPKLAMLLKRLGITTVNDILWFFPRRYDDRTKLPQLIMLRPGEAVTVRGKLVEVRTRSTRGGKVLIRAILDDGTSQIALIWFNQPWIARDLQRVQGEIIAFGKVQHGQNHSLEMSAPEWEALDEDDDSTDFARIMPVYPLTEGVPQRVVRTAARSAVEYFCSQISDPIPESIRKANRLQSLAWCLRQMHMPESEPSLAAARKRIVFEEFLYLQLGLQMRKLEVEQETGISFPISSIESLENSSSDLFATEDSSTVKGDAWEQLRSILPFQLTAAQTRVITEIWRDMEQPHPMNRLVQGDVGSGKTAVAAAGMLAAVRCGYQAAMMAPTEILAEQHYINLHRLFDPVGIRVNLLVGKQNTKQKRAALEATETGTASICVGTHALISEGVKFHKLGLVVIDEQHRFGVIQRMALRQKGLGNPDVLVMTATPIPRTLTMTLYGDLDLSVIDELPPGRKPIKTHWKKPWDREKVYQTVRQLVKEGRQAYFVCPMINESEKMQTQAAEDLYYRLSQDEFKDLRVGLLHGQMKPADKEAVMESFRKHEIDILVSTVVIEVGVDVPNASIMVIEDANRFGLAQLHQLRGRVGRGEHQSFCVLIAQATNLEAEQRLRVLEQTTSGFVIAEEDLRIRGPGDVAGTRQSGALEFKLANLVDDGPVLEEARQVALYILKDDPSLSKPQNLPMLAKVKERRSDDALITVS
ncbi:ATP-dependent DNA helicase RecG [Kamptonema cortianum]|nr:ATP-dependent DNA helicase RecG [Geitlerinema splendidum]MDK3157700.1 ATP-dependent DNA helicase RecG [Kamptonema cortianum]